MRKDLTKKQIDFIIANRLKIPISEMAKISDCSVITVRKHYNVRKISYLNDRLKIKEYKTKGALTPNDPKLNGYKPKNLTQGEKKHIYQEIKPPERFF